MSAFSREGWKVIQVPNNGGAKQLLWRFFWLQAIHNTAFLQR